MRALPMLAALALLALAAPASAQSGSTTPPAASAGSTADSVAGDFKRGLDRLGEAAEQGASDLWAAGKAAYEAGARTLHEREAARAQPKEPDNSGR